MFEIEFMIVALGVLVGLIIYWYNGQKQPANASSARGFMSSSKARNIAIAAVAMITIAAAWWMWGASLPSTSSITPFVETYWLWFLGAIIAILLVWKEPSMAKFIIGAGVFVVVVLGIFNYMWNGSIIPQKEPISIVAQPEGSTVLITRNQPLKLYLGMFTISQDPSDKGVSCDLDASQPFALDAEGSTRTSEFITMTPIAQDRSNGQLYVIISPVSSTFEAEAIPSVKVLCYDADPA